MCGKPQEGSRGDEHVPPTQRRGSEAPRSGSRRPGAGPGLLPCRRRSTKLSALPEGRVLREKSPGGRREQTCWQREPLREAAPVTGKETEAPVQPGVPLQPCAKHIHLLPMLSCVCSYTAGLRCQESQPLVAPSVTLLPSEQDRKSASRHCSSLRPLTQCRDQRMQVESLILLPPSE